MTNTLAHAALGALEAKVTGNNAAAGAMAGASSELAAPLIAKALYGTDDPKQLTEVQKQNIVNLSSLAGAMGAGIANGNGSGTEVLTSANQGAEIGKRAVENNYLSIADVQNFIRELSKAQKEGRDTKPILEKYKGISEENRQQLIACKGNVACETAHLHEMNTGAEELDRNLGFFSRMTVYYPNDLNTANRIALSNLVERENAESFSKLSDTTKFGLNAMEAGTAIGLGAAAGSAKVGLSNVKSLINGKNKAYPTSGMDGYKLVANTKPQVIPKEANANSNLPPAGETKGYDLKSFNYEAHNAKVYQDLKMDLKTQQSANSVIEHLQQHGKLPDEYVTKTQARQQGWSGKNALHNGQIGGDIYRNDDLLLPTAKNRIWYEADIGIDSSIARNKQAGTRLLYSNDGLIFITTDHYKTFKDVGRWK